MKPSSNHGRRIRSFFRVIFTGVTAVLLTQVAVAETFTGSNGPKAASTFSFPSSGTNFAVSVTGSSTAYSYLYLKKGVAPTATSYDFASQFTGQSNWINLELPEASVGTWYARVANPSSSTTHTFTLTAEHNVTNSRTVRPISKPLTFTTGGALPAGKWNYFRIEMPTNPVSLKFTVSGTNLPDCYVQKGRLPTPSSYLKKRTGQTNNMFGLAETEVSPSTYFIGIYSGSAGTNHYTLKSEIVSVTPLTWDPGTSDTGTYVITNTTSSAGEFYYKVRTASPAVGAWRTALKVVSGEADIFMTRGTIPGTNSATYVSTRVGSDGFVLGSGQFAAGEDWYILVRTKAFTTFQLLSGAAYVQNIGVLTDSSTAPGVIGPEGWRFFKTTTPSDLLAWRLGLNGLTNMIYLKKTSVPLAKANEQSQSGQMLVVPPYLVGGQQYYVGIEGAPGTSFNLDCRRQPIVDIPFSSVTDVVAGINYGYNTFRVVVPTNALAWQIDLAATNGNPHVYVRRNFVPSDKYNEALSENPRSLGDTITLVPSLLSDGTFYVTVAGTNAYNCTLSSGQPTITDINFETTVVNDQTSRVGWRYYRVANIAQQTGSLGWELLLSNHRPGTKIVLRRNKVPSLWNYRLLPSAGQTKNFDYCSTSDFLQRPAHQADIWYVGIYNPSTNLGAFTLTTRKLTAPIINGDGGSGSVSALAPLQWKYFRVDVPASAQGWDVRLNNVNSNAMPKLVIRREYLPEPVVGGGLVTTNVQTTVSASSTNWTGGQQWVAAKDWTRRVQSSTGQLETGRLLAMGMGRPLQPATYYIGVYNINNTPVNCQVLSRFIGKTNQIKLREFAYSGGVTNGTIAPRQADYYHVSIPAGARSWKVKLTATNGEVMVVISTNKIPNVEMEKRVQKTGSEHYLLLPNAKPVDLSVLGTRDCYIAVVGEGFGATGDRIGTGNATYRLTSFGALPEVVTGSFTTNTLKWAGSSEGGETKCYRYATGGNVRGYYTRLLNKIGNPVMVGRGGTLLPDPGLAGPGADLYGNEGGKNDRPHVAASATEILTSTFGGGYDTLMVKARSLNGGYPDAQYTVQIDPIFPVPIPFEGSRVVGWHTNSGWQFFRIDVPGSAQGWDVRLENVEGFPKMAICSGTIPWQLATYVLPGHVGFPKDVDWYPSEIWQANRDWTGRSLTSDGRTNEDGRILTMGMSKPLAAGTYYIGVYASSYSKYTIRSRGIGAGYTIPITGLNFAGGSVSSDVPARDAAFYRVTVPNTARGWKLKLVPAKDADASLVVLKDLVPNIAADATGSSTNVLLSGGRKLQKLGTEHFLLLPGTGQTNLAGGTFYLAAISEGTHLTNSSRIGAGSAGFTLTSSPLSITDLGTLTTSITNVGSLEGAECAVYRFSVPVGTMSIQARLENRVGNPVMVMRSGGLIPNPGFTVPGVGGDSYGTESGENGGSLGSATLINVGNPTNGLYHLIVKARAVNGVYTNASYTLRLTATGPIPLTFDGGRYTVTNQQVGAWQYFRVDVPAQASLLGWDLRLTNVSGGSPKLVIRRDVVPDALTMKGWGSPGALTNWASSNQWAVGVDWTKRRYAEDGTTDESGRVFAAGIGHPLEPGTYYIGVANLTGTNAAFYSIMSRGIGTGYSIKVADVAFNNGVATNIIVAPREAAYYRVSVPTNMSSWKMKVTGLSGEVMLAGYEGALPCIDHLEAGIPLASGKSMQKPGNEHYLMLPTGTNTSVPSGIYYFAVVGEGTTATNIQRIGSGNSKFAIQSAGKLPINYLGLASATSIDRIDSLEAGDEKIYQFAIRPDALAIEVQLENRTGNPVMVLHTNSLPAPGGNVAGLGSDTYGNDGGAPPVNGHAYMLPIANPNWTGVYVTNTIVVKARSSGALYSDASYKLRVRELFATDLNLSAADNVNGGTNIVSGQLEDNQRALFKVVIPSDQELPLGWKLEARQSSGLAFVRVRKDFPPSDQPQAGTQFESPASYIVPPVFTNGTWYVEVKGQNSTAFTLTSSTLELERPAWTMPSFGSGTAVGDTGIGTNGVALPGDQGIDLEQGYQNYYAVDVPDPNNGLLRFELRAISGNPDLYIRTNNPPTKSHGISGNGGGSIFERSMTATTTQYGNWVPFSAAADQLPPGRWYFAVRAAGNANARYRVRMTLANFQNVTLATPRLTNQFLNAGDWRYYKLQLGSATEWWVNFAQESGDVYLFLREGVPPGSGASPLDLRFGSQFKRYDVPGTYGFTNGPATCYLGFYAVNDASFSVKIATSAGSATLASVNTGETMTLTSTSIVPILTAPRMNGGKFQFNLHGQAKGIYSLEASSNLINWIPVGSVTNDNNGNAPVLDLSATNFPMKFYRVHSR